MKRKDLRDSQGSSPWAFMRFQTLTTATGEIFLARVRIVQTPWASIYLHRLDVPDPGVDLHDHPWPFVSLILRGGYTEVVTEARQAHTLDRPEGYRYWRSGTVHRLRATEAHRIYRLDRSPTWTLVLTGPRSRSWGFYTSEGYVEHQQYETSARGLARTGYPTNTEAKT